VRRCESAVADDDVGFSREDGPDQIRDTFLGVLVVAIGVDHDVRALAERIVNAVAERSRQTHVGGVPEDVCHTVLAGHLDSAISGAIIDDENFDLIDAVDMGGHASQYQRQRRLLIEARHLDDEFHPHRIPVVGAYKV